MKSIGRTAEGKAREIARKAETGTAQKSARRAQLKELGFVPLHIEIAHRDDHATIRAFAARLTKRRGLP